MKWALILFFWGMPFASYPDVQATIAYLEQILDTGKKIAILYIDMQTGMTSSFYPEEFYYVIEQQTRLLHHFVDNDRVFFIDVNLSENGPTLSHSLNILKQKETYKQLIKKSADAFDNITFIDTESQEMINTSLDHYLQSIDVNDIHIVGSMDEFCVKKTAKHALQNHYNVSVDSDMNIIGIKRNKVNEIRRTKNYAFWKKLQDQYPALYRTTYSLPSCSE